MWVLNNLVHWKVQVTSANQNGLVHSPPSFAPYTMLTERKERWCTVGKLSFLLGTRSELS